MRSKMLRAFATSLLALFVIGTPVLFAAEKPRVAILPFTLHGPDNLTYLKDGILAMLGSRLSAGAGVSVIGQGEIIEVLERLGKDAPVAVVSEELKADLVLAGSITSLGQGISVDLKGFQQGAKSGEESFFASAGDQAAIIGAVDDLANDIGFRVFGKPSIKAVSRSSRKAGDVGSGNAVAITPDASAPPGKSAHPDRLFSNQIQPIPVGGAHQPMPRFAGYSGMVGRSQYLNMEIQDFDSGDVFGDGTTQIVVTDKNKIQVYRQDENQLKKIMGVPAPPKYYKIVNLNLADMDQDGKDEIYISAISDNYPMAYAVKWNGESFTKLFDRQPWHIRPLQLPGQGWVLAGQKNDFDDSPVVPGIYIMKVEDGVLQPGEKLAVPAEVNLFEFAMADFTGDGHIETAFVNQRGALFLFGDDGSNLWDSDDKYGYTVRYIGPTISEDDSGKKNFIVPSRLIAADFNQDGRSELVVMKEPTGLSVLIKTIGSFTGGSVQVLGWNGVSFRAIWETGKIGSYIADYTISGGDSGNEELFVALLGKKSGKLLKTSRSFIATYPLATVARQ